MKERSGEIDIDALTDAYSRKWADTKQAIAQGIEPPPPQPVYDIAQLVDAYSRKWDDTKQAIAQGIDAPAQREQDHQQRHADTEDAIRQIHATLMDHLNEQPPSIEIIRDETGRASAIRKGDRIMTIERGPNGRAIGLK